MSEGSSRGLFGIVGAVAGASIAAIAALPVACSSADGANAPAADDAGDAASSDASGEDAANAGDGAASALSAALSAHVTPGEDSYHCLYVSVPGAATDTMFFVGASHTYGIGGHHVLVFRTDLTALAAGQTTERDCFAPDDVMPHARAQIYGAQSKTGNFDMPSGVGLALHGGDVLLVQVHYLNASATAVDTRVDVSLRLATDGITQRAGAFFFADPFVDIGPGQRARAAMRCAFPSDATVLAATGYAHAEATDFAAFVDAPSGAPNATAFYHAPGAANPLPFQGAAPIAAGGHVRFACAFDNTRGTTEIFGGPSAALNEACVLSGLYVPDLGDDVGACRTAPDEFGTGTATCAQTKTCVDACAAGDASAPPQDLGLGTGAAADPCWQTCIAASCVDASALLFAARACLAAGGSCAAEVAACDADSCP